MAAGHIESVFQRESWFLDQSFNSVVILKVPFYKINYEHITFFVTNIAVFCFDCTSV